MVINTQHYDTDIPKSKCPKVIKHLAKHTKNLYKLQYSFVQIISKLVIAKYFRFAKQSQAIGRVT